MRRAALCTSSIVLRAGIGGLIIRSLSRRDGGRCVEPELVDGCGAGGWTGAGIGGCVDGLGAGLDPAGGGRARSVVELAVALALRAPVTLTGFCFLRIHG